VFDPRGGCLIFASHTMAEFAAFLKLAEAKYRETGIPLTTRCGSGIGYGNGSCVSQ
jgi:hypothetical protein